MHFITIMIFLFFRLSRNEFWFFPLYNLQHLDGRHEAVYRSMFPSHAAVWHNLASRRDAILLDEVPGVVPASHSLSAGHEGDHAQGVGGAGEQCAAGGGHLFCMDSYIPLS